MLACSNKVSHQRPQSVSTACHTHVSGPSLFPGPQCRARARAGVFKPTQCTHSQALLRTHVSEQR
eukprot:12197482-Alexandrium_andersonii.AAC.1